MSNTLQNVIKSIKAGDNEHYIAKGRFVFADFAGTHYYVIVQADEESGLLNDFGLVTCEF